MVRMFAESLLMINTLYSVLIFATLTAGVYSLVCWFRGRPVLPGRGQFAVDWPLMTPLYAFVTWVVVTILVQSVARSYVADDLLRGIQAGTAVRLATALALIGLAFQISPRPRNDLGVDSQSSLHEALLGLGATAIVFFPVMLVSHVLTQIGWKEPDAMHPLLKAISGDPSGQMLLWVVLSAVIAAPLSEELLYRVFFQGPISNRCGGLIGVAISSALFCAVHFEKGRPDGIPLVPLSLMLGFLFHRRRSLIGIVTCHASFNALNVLFAVLELRRIQ